VSNAQPLRFPINFFPEDIEKHIDAVAEQGQFNRDAVCLSVLISMGVAIGKDHFLDKPFPVTPIFWGAFISPSGTAKTPTLKTGIKPLVRLDNEFASMYQREKRDYDHEMEKKKEDRKKGLTAPNFKQIIVKDITKESLLQVHQFNPKSILLFNDELMGLLASFGQYKGGKGNDQQIFLELFDGGSVKVNRKLSDPIHLEETCMSILGGLQPSRLSEFVANGRLGDGFFFRFLFVHQPKANLRLHGIYEGPKVDNEPYIDFIKKLYALPGRKFYRLNQEADQIYGEWYNKHAYAVLEDEVEAGIQSKLNTYVLRLALLHRIIHRPLDVDSDIEVESMQIAIEAIEFFRTQTYSVLEYLHKSEYDKLPESKQAFLECLTTNTKYSYKELEDLAVEHGILPRSFRRWLAETKLIIKVSHGVYKKKDL